MCTRSQCEQAVGKWVSFQTRYGTHRGIVEEVNGRGVLIRVPRQYVPATLLSGSDEDKLNVGLAQWGAPYGGYGGGYNPRWGYPGYGAWGGGWWWWWLAFSWIFLLAFLW